MSVATYALGSAPRELSRLSLQAQILRPITERLLWQAGIGEGLRVLDLGCGPGDVSMLAAELVGPTGRVVGIDQSGEAIARATERSRESGFEIDFQAVRVEDFSSSEQFDAVIGRYVLIHQASPVDFLRAARRHVRPGGVIAFHEVDLTRRTQSAPPSPLFDRMGALLRMAGVVGFGGYDAATRLAEHFHHAGLPYPEMFGEVPVSGGPDSPFYVWMAETIRSLTPMLVKIGGITEEELAIDTLEERLRTEAVERVSQLEAPIQICAWARV